MSDEDLGREKGSISAGIGKDEASFRNISRRERKKKKIDYLCDAIKGMFDHIFGTGTGIRVCGSGNDRLRHLSAYEQLVREQIQQSEQYAQIVKRMKSMRRGV